MNLRAIAVAATIIGALAMSAMAIISPAALLPWGVPVVVSVIVGGALTIKAPANPVGWAVMVFATTAAVGALATVLAEEVASPTASGWFDAVGSAINTAGVLALPWALLRFPDGRLVSAHWRVVEWLVIAAAVLGGVAALLNSGWGGDVDQAVQVSPLRGTTAPLGDVLSAVFFPAMSVAMITSAASLIIRYRHSAGEIRLQIKWLAYAGAFLIATFVTIIATAGAATVDALWQQTMVAIAFAALPAAIGVAVLKYRLYDIDVVINRTVVLGVLAAFITSVYAAVVVGVGALLGGRSGLALPIAATAMVAVAFEPVRHVSQRWANRLVYGRRASPYEVLADLTERLAVAESEEGVLDRMAMLLCDGTGAARASVWLGDDDRLRLGASAPPDVPVAATASSGHLDGDRFPVHHGGGMVGMLEVVKPRGSTLTPTERDLVLDLAGSAGLLLGHQRLNESLAMRARELGESRTRLVEAQDTERRRLERVLHDGAQQQIVALKVQLGLAAKLAAGHDDLVRLLIDLGDEAQAALEEVRALAKGIYPPLLASDGLKAAIGGLAGSAPVEVSVHGDGIGRYPADIEAAVYFNVSEAITNAVKHGDPPIHVALSADRATLGYEVRDAGPGFDPAVLKASSGVRNMADRMDAVGGALRIDSAPGRSTIVAGAVPIRGPSAPTAAR
jgi:signal transduction histidine kinase